MLRDAGCVNPRTPDGLTFSGREYTVRLDHAGKQNAAQYAKQFPLPQGLGLENSIQGG